MSSRWNRTTGHLCGLLVLAILCPLFMAAPAVAAPADDEYTLAVTLYGQKRWELARDTFQSYLKSYPNHGQAPLAKLYLAQSLVNLQNYKDARNVLRDFLKNHPENKNLGQAMYRVAECSYFLDDFDSAITEFEAFLKKAPDDQLVEWALPYLADAYLRTNKPVEAEKQFRASLEKFPNGRFVEDSRFGLARSLELQNKNAEAIDQYQLLTEMKEAQRIDESLFNLGMLYFQDNRFQEAAGTFSDLATRDPQGRLAALARLNAGYALYSLEDWDKAVEQFAAAEQNEQYGKTASYWIAQTYKRSGNLEQAAQRLDQLMKETQDSDLLPKIHFQLADSRFQLGNYDQALPLFLEYLKKYPKGESAIDARLAAIEACLLTNQLGQGWELAEQEFETKPTERQSNEATLLKARLLSAGTSEKDPLPDSLGDRSTRLAKATELLDGVLKSVSDQTDRFAQQAHYQAARVLQERGNHPAAIAVISPVTRDLEPEKLQYPESWLLLASSEYETAAYDSALKSLDQYEQLVGKETPLTQANIVRMNVLIKLGDVAAAREALANLRTAGIAPSTLAEATYQLAELSYARQQWDTAQELYQQVIDLKLSDDWTIKALSGQAWSYFEAGDFAKADQRFDKLQQDFPKSAQVAAEAGYMQGMSRLRAGEQNEAAEAFLKTAQAHRSPSDVATGNEVHHVAYRAAREAARIYRQQKKVDQSAEAYRIAYEELRKQPENRRTELDKLLDEWALLHYESEQFALADQVFEILLKETPNSDRADDALLSLAESDFVDGEIESARQRLDMLLEQKQIDEFVKRRALYQRVMVAASENNTEAVKEYATRYLKESGGSPTNAAEVGEIELQLIQLFMDQNQLAEARDQLASLRERALAIPDDNRPDWFPRMYVQTGELARRSKDYQKAKDALEVLRKEYPNTPEREELEVIVGRIHIAEANFEAAEQAFRAVLDRAAGTKSLAAAQSQFYLAETALIQKDYRLAIKEYIRMAILFPGFPDLQSAALYQAGQCDEVLGNKDQAIINYENLIRLYPESEFATRASERVQALKPAG